MFTYINKRQSDFAISRGFYFHETSHMRSFAKIKSSRKFPNLQYVNDEKITSYQAGLISRPWLQENSQFRYFMDTVYTFYLKKRQPPYWLQLLISLTSLIIYIICYSVTVLPAKSDSDVMLCLHSYQGLRLDRSRVVNPILRIRLIRK